MARTKHDAMKRKLGQVLNNTDNALLDLKEIYEIFEPIHPELAEGLKVSIELIIHSQDVIELFSLKCWNTSKDSLLKYR